MLTESGLGWFNGLACLLPKMRQIVPSLIAKVHTSNFGVVEVNRIYS